ncbi:MAG: hypothetical protein PVJ27_08000 [Candidatus Brocadiaceae bacterium]
MRDGRWKLVSYYNEKHEQRPGTGRRTGQWQLYDLEADRTELNGLVDVYPEKARELQQTYEQWARRTGVLDWEDAVRSAGLDRPENL